MGPFKESIEQVRTRQNTELLIRNNPLSLHPQALDVLLAQSFPPKRWVVQGLIPSEGLTIMSAAPGSFKTWMMLEIALRVAEGTDLFDKYTTEKLGVLIVDEESGARMLNERFKKLRAPLDLPIHYFSREGHKVTEEYIDSLVSVCLSNSIGLVIFDSLVRLHQGDENTSKDMAELFDRFKRLSDHGIAVLIAHHNRKSQPGAYSPSGDMRGSSDILAAIDCHIAINRHNNSDYVEVRQTKNRYIQELPPFKLRFVDNGDFNKFHFIGELENKKKHREYLKQSILMQLTKKPLPNKKNLHEDLETSGIEIKMRDLTDLLEELKRDQKIETKPGSRTAVHYFIPEASIARGAEIRSYNG